MVADLTIPMPVHPAIMGIFLGILVLAFVYYVIKFIASLVTGG